MPPNHYLHLAFKLLKFNSLARSNLILIHNAKKAMTPRPKELYPLRDASDAEIHERTHNPVPDPEDQSAELPSPRTSFTLPRPEEMDRMARSEDPAERARGQTQQWYQMQLMLLEQQYKRYKMVMEREGKDPESSSS